MKLDWLLTGDSILDLSLVVACGFIGFEGVIADLFVILSVEPYFHPFCEFGFHRWHFASQGSKWQMMQTKAHQHGTAFLRGMEARQHGGHSNERWLGGPPV